MRNVSRWLLVFAILTIAIPLLADSAAAEKPNIIFIMADDLGYGDLGCYGQKVIQTPNLDRMAAEGIRFTDCYAGSTVCAPSRSVLMTGQHSGHTLVRGNARVPLRPEDVTVAELLREGGYTTGIIGKWGLGEPDTTGIPNRQGFDYWFGYLNQRHAHNYYPEYLWQNESKALLRNKVDHIVNGSDRTPGGVATKRVDYSADLFAGEALEFLTRHRKETFFLYLPFTIPHANNEAGNRGMEVPSYEPYAEEDWPDPQKGHAAMITRMDRDIGRIFARIKELGIDEKTVVFFTSDNGPHREGGADPDFFHSSGPLQGYKRSLHDGGIRVPGMVRWPGRVKPGVSDHPWYFADFLPTACALAGLDVPEKIDGISIVPTLLGQGDQPKHEFMYWEFHEGRASKQAVRMGHFKAVRPNPSAPIELYDLRSDIAERNNIAAEHPEVVAKIAEYLKTARTDSKHWPLRDVGKK